MKNKKEIIAGIIVIGNEILSGRTQDTNTQTLSIWLNSIGIKVYEVRIIPDVEEVIIDLSVVKGQSQPITVYSKTNTKNKSSKTSAA